ncbi:hypothetical protein FQR65_LT06653 [Abscondita terminalis]|nr:hypothetical protein FQR65_LT06653 [Abscondita terminalis]
MLLNDNVNQCFSDIFKPPPDYDQLPDKPFCPGFLFDLSYAWVMLTKHALWLSAAVVTEKTADSENCVCKPSELPIYTKDPCIPSKPEISPTEPGVVESGVGTVRRTLFQMGKEIDKYSSQAQELVVNGITGAGELIEYLQNEENSTPKYGAIAIGGFTGFIFGLRGRFFKKLIYTSTGALSMAALCYPKQAMVYSKTACGYATVLMNFIYGVDKDDPSLQLPSLPKFPDSLSDAWSKIKSFGSTGEKQPANEVKKPKIDTAKIVSEAHDIATSKSCHCPIDTCKGSHEENLPSPDETVDLE